MIDDKVTKKYDEIRENSKHMIAGIEAEANEKVERFKSNTLVVGMVVGFFVIVAIAGVVTLAV